MAIVTSHRKSLEFVNRVPLVKSNVIGDIFALATIRIQRLFYSRASHLEIGIIRSIPKDVITYSTSLVKKYVLNTKKDKALLHVGNEIYMTEIRGIKLRTSQ